LQKRVLAALAACVLTWVVLPVSAQDIEPRAYSNAPIGVNFLIAGYAYTRGGVAFGAQLPLPSRPQYFERSPRTPECCSIRGMSIEFDATVPYHGSRDGRLRDKPYRET
jgi:hypothetical protein